MRPYVPLWVKSNFSFLEGASHPEELVETAVAHGLPALGLCDRNGLYGVVRAHVRARELGLPLLLGAQVSVGPAELAPLLPRPEVEAGLERVLLFPTSRRGHGHLARLLTLGRQRAPKGHALVQLDELAAHGEGLIAVAPDPGLLAPLHGLLGDRLYALCVRHRHPDDAPLELRTRLEAERLGVPIVAGAEVLYHQPGRRALQDVLACIRRRSSLALAGKIIRGNAEHDLKSAAAMRALFADHPDWLDRTLELAQRCQFSLDALRYVYPAEQVPEGHEPHGWLRTLTQRGALERYGGQVPPDVQAQIERELELITELDYGGYFLTMWEIVQFCRREGILCQGRGSAANSVVCYCLGITAIDPVRMDLLFERFLSRERAEAPDIDLDIEHERREQVIQWVYERYGRRRAAMVANFVRYRARSAVRDVGKVLGLPEVALDRVAKLMSYHDGAVEPRVLEQAGLDPQHPPHAHLLRLVGEIADFPRHLSIHPGGFLLGHAPVDELVPVEPASMEGRSVIQWDKYDVEALGLFKVDLLGLGALSHVRRTLELLRETGEADLTMATIPHEDPATYALISRGDTVGVFQIESRAQMAMLPRLQPRTFYDLVIEVAIVRPGPIQGDMVHPYLRRRQGKERVEYPHPALERVLAKTLGVPIFQEQVMRLAVLAADYTPGEADQLRRDMAAWRSSGRIDAHRERLISRMLQRGIDLAFAERVFEQIRGFGEYGFPESHAASFALIAYVTAWLRTHHPAAFACGLLNAQPMGFYTPATLVEDTRRRGVIVRPVDVLHSAWDCRLEGRGAIRMGLRYVQGLGTREQAQLEASGGPHPDLETFVRRSGLHQGALLRLAEAGAFGGYGLDRRDALWAVRGLVPRRHDALPLAKAAQTELFAPLSAGERILWDYRSSHHSARGHPMMLARAGLAALGLHPARRINELPDGARVRFVGVVICRQRPENAGGVCFFTLEDETGFVNLVVWRPVFDRHERLAKTAPVLGVSGKLQSTDGVTHLVAESLWAPQLDMHPEGHSSRDFH